MPRPKRRGAPVAFGTAILEDDSAVSPPLPAKRRRSTRTTRRRSPSSTISSVSPACENDNMPVHHAMDQNQQPPNVPSASDIADIVMSRLQTSGLLLSTPAATSEPATTDPPASSSQDSSPLPLFPREAVCESACKPLSREAQAFEIEDDQPETVKTESDTSEASDATEVSRAAHVQVYALESYTSLLPGHLSFHTGPKIKQKEAANEEGLAYGYIIKNKYTRRRTYGLYPVRLVAIKVPSKKRWLKDFFREK